VLPPLPLLPPRQVGKFDPVTRHPMTESDVLPNAALRVATMQYLDEHPWAWGECF
jgi:STIP1 family protein 1